MLVLRLHCRKHWLEGRLSMRERLREFNHIRRIVLINIRVAYCINSSCQALVLLMINRG